MVSKNVFSLSLFNRPIDQDALVPHPWDKMFSMLVVKSPFVISKHFAGISEHQEVGVFITVTDVLLHGLLFLYCSATIHGEANILHTIPFRTKYYIICYYTLVLKVTRISKQPKCYNDSHWYSQNTILGANRRHVEKQDNATELRLRVFVNSSHAINYDFLL